MANDTGKLLKEISSLSSNMDILFQELKEQSKTNLEASKGLKDLATSLKDSNKGGGNVEQTFKSFTESFSKTFSDQNNKLISSLTEKMTQSFTGSVSDFLSNVPNQIAQVKSGNSPDFKNLLGGDTIKGLVGKASQKIPGLADGGTVEKNGLAVVGEKGPELVELKAGSTVKTSAEDALMDSLLTSKSGVGVTDSDYDVETFMKLRKAVKELSPTEPDSFVSAFIKYAQTELDPSELPEFLSDPDYLKDELSYFNDSDARERYEYKDYGTPINTQEIKKVQPPAVTVEASTPKLEEVVTSSPAPTPEKPAEQVKAAPTLKDLTSSNLSAASALESYKQQLLSKLPEDKRKELEASVEAKKASLVKEQNTLKEKAPEQKPSTPSPTPAPTPTPAKVEEPSKTPSSDLKSQIASQFNDVKTQMSQATGMGGAGIPTKDLNEIKALLASIYGALKAPLTVSSDFPFRPNSNNF
jgi:hypothetical protein